MHKKIGYIAFFFAVAIFLYGCHNDKKEQQDVVARVDECVMRTQDIFVRVPPEFLKNLDREQFFRIVEDWVDEKLLAEYAVDNGAENDEEIKRKLEEARNQIFVDYVRNKIISQRIKISERDVEKYYLSHQSDFIRDRAEIHALHIHTPSKVIADSIKKMLAADSSFCAVARKYSSEYYDRDSCDLGWFSKSDILPRLVRPVFSAKPGEVVGPVKIDEDYHFFKIIERGDEGTVRPLEQVKEEIYGRLFSARFNELLSNLLDSLRAAKTVVIDTFMIDSLSQGGKNVFRKHSSAGDSFQ